MRFPPTSLLAYTPFVQPIPGLWDYWLWLLIPLALAVGVVYKSIKAPRMSSVPRQALLIALWILLSMAAAGAALAGVVRALEK